MSSADWQNTPFTLPLLLTGLLCGWVGYVAHRRRAVPGAGAFSVLMAGLAGWAVVNLVEKSLVNPDLRRVATVALYPFILTVPGAWLVFGARYSRQDGWLPPRRVALLVVEPALIFALVVTNPWHGLIHSAAEMRADGPYVVQVITHGPFFYVNAAYNWVLFTAGTVLLVTGVLRQPGESGGRVALLVLALLVPLAGNAAYVFGLQPRRLTDLTPVYFAIPGLVSAWLLFRVRVFDVLPVARDFVLDCLSDAVFVLDTGHRVLDANQAGRRLLPGGRPRRQRLAEALPELAPYLPEAAGGAVEVQLATAGAGRYWDVHATPLIDHGVAIGSLVRLTEVTERRRAAEALREADRQKDEFLAMLAHELRNPLAPIRLSLENMKRAGPGGLAAARQTIERQVGHLVRLVDDLLDVSRITRGKIQLRKEPVELSGVVAQALETSRPALDARRHELTVGLPEGPVWLEADVTRLAQVFSNLLNNAAKFTDPGGRVWLTAGREGGEVVVRVRDNGAGMTEELLGRAFDLFAQGDRSLARSQGGLGIGLTLARRLVEMHGGTVEAFSGGPGRGSELVVRLPGLEGPAPRAEARAANGCPGARRRVLIVDDNVDAANSLACYLGMSGHDVTTAYDGPQALDAARAVRPEAVLLDIGMPGMSGYEVARRLRREVGLERVLVVAISGYGQEEDRRRSREAGIDHHLVKPVEPAELLALLGPAAAPGRAP